MSLFLPSATTTDAKRLAGSIAVLPVGSFEQHGPHLPLVTDTLVAVAISQAIAAVHEVFLLASVSFSCSHEHLSFPGTLSLSPTTLAAIVTDLADSASQQGMGGLLVVNGHGGNYVLANVVQAARATGSFGLGLYPARQDWTDARVAAGMETDAHTDMHAGELETSILLAAFPGYVQDGYQGDDHICDDRRHLTTLGVAAYTNSGVIGRPSLATAHKGRGALDALADGAGTILRHLEHDAKDS
jgi:creatinine amidohydrolase